MTNLCPKCSKTKNARRFYCTDANDIKNKKLAERVRYFKEDEEGVTVMSNIFEEIRLEGEKSKANEIATNMLVIGIPIKQICRVTGLSELDVKVLKTGLDKNKRNNDSKSTNSNRRIKTTY